MKSPLNTSPGTIFILGATPLDKFYDRQEYQIAHDKTVAMNYEAVNPIEILEGVDPKFPYLEYELLADWICYLAKCDKVLTLNSYEQSLIGNKILKIAQSMGKEVMLAEKFFKHIA